LQENGADVVAGESAERAERGGERTGRREERGTNVVERLGGAGGAVRFEKRGPSGEGDAVEEREIDRHGRR
jgi:hypothetical protein